MDGGAVIPKGGPPIRQLWVLDLLSDGRRWPSMTLVEKSGVEKSTLYDCLRSLQRAGRVERIPGPQNAARWRITPAGRAWLAARLAALGGRAVLPPVVVALPPTDQATLPSAPTVVSAEPVPGGPYGTRIAEWRRQGVSDELIRQRLRLGLADAARAGLRIAVPVQDTYGNDPRGKGRAAA